MKESTIDFIWLGICLIVAITILYIGIRELTPNFRFNLFFAGWFFGIIAMYLPKAIRDARSEKRRK